MWYAALLVLAVLVLAPPASISVPQDEARRDRWQRPAEVLDALGITVGSRVADVGCGEGYFVLHLARRVGTSGVVYAVDIDPEALATTRRKVERAGFPQVRLVLSREDDPRLPEDELDAVLIVNAYHEMHKHDAMLGGIFRALKPGGRLAIIDGAGEEHEDRTTLLRRHRMSRKLVREDAERNGFRFREERPGFDRPGRNARSFFFLIFEKPAKGVRTPTGTASHRISWLTSSLTPLSFRGVFLTF
ncbi:MAG: class I SAM-dependent methyltransferase [Firmicutes bacterium]|nr:class I SAM-dependent methyltransferase [Bacillota bacterium]